MTTTNTEETSLFGLFKQALKGDTNRDLTKGPINTAIILLAVPMVMEMIMESVLAITDIFFVASLGADAVAVVALTESVLSLLYVIVIGLGMAASATVARRIGEKNFDSANQVAGQIMLIGFFVALAVSFTGMWFTPEILQLMGAEPSVIKEQSGFTRLTFAGSITIVYLFLLNAIFRGAGDVVIAMRSLWIANGINLVLDPLLIYGIGPFPEMGVAGAAMATIIGRGVGVAYQLHHLWTNNSRIRMKLADLMPQIKVLTELLKISIGGILQAIIATASWLVLIRIVSIFGSTALAGYTIALRIGMFIALPASGISGAAAVLVGQNLGADNPEKAERSVWKVAKYNVYYMLAIAFIFLIFAEVLIGFFANDNQVIAYGASFLRYVSYGHAFFAIGMVLSASFNGAGDTMTPSKINFFCYWIFQLPIAYWLAITMELGPDGVFIAIALAQSLMAIVAAMVFRRGGWKLQKV